MTQVKSNDSTSTEISRFDLLCACVAEDLGQSHPLHGWPAYRSTVAAVRRMAVLHKLFRRPRRGKQIVGAQPTRTRTAGRARRSPACVQRATTDSGPGDPDPEPRPPALTPAPKNRRSKKYVRTLAGSIDDPRVSASSSPHDDDDKYIYSRGPRQKSIIKISPAIIAKFAEHGWARCQREADFFLQIAKGYSITGAAGRVGVGRTTGYNWLHRAHAQIVAAGQPDGEGVRAEKISGQAWQPPRRGRRRERLISRQPRSLRIRHLQHQQMDLLPVMGGAA